MFLFVFVLILSREESVILLPVRDSAERNNNNEIFLKREPLTQKHSSARCTTFKHKAHLR